MRTVLRVGGLVVATGLAFVAGRVSGHQHERIPRPASPAEGAAADPRSPSRLPPWATQGFRDGETCDDAFKDPG